MGKENIGVVAHQASLVNHKTHLIDTLLSLGVNISKVFAPEHGFRGDADAGESVADQKDLKTGLPILSLYGSNKKPSEESLEGINIMLFDLQDVGVRFYTYLSTLHYVMEACAENGIPLIILDRPNPNAHYTDGPILEEDCKSFVGMHPRSHCLRNDHWRIRQNDQRRGVAVRWYTMRFKGCTAKKLYPSNHIRNTP